MGGDHPAGGGSPPRGYGGPGEEEPPEPAEGGRVLLDDLGLVPHPVLVPLVEGKGIVDTDVLDVLDLEASLLELVDVPVEGGGGISTREDVLGHEDSPGHVLPVGSLPESGDLHVKGAVVLEVGLRGAKRRTQDC